MEKSGQIWDDSLRSLVRANPEAFIKWLLSDAQYKEERPHKLKSWKLEVDALLHAIADGEDMLVHIEFQTYNDTDMAERLLRYNVLARSEYNLPVLSFVIYLLSDGKVPQSPLSWKVPGGQEVLQFHFRSIELAELLPGDLLEIGHPGLLPLLPLTKGGASREVIQRMFTEIEATDQAELLTIGSTLASLVFSKENSADLEWLHRRLREMNNILRESPFYQEILQEGREEGLEMLRQAFLKIVEARFPKLLRLAKGQAAITDDPEELENLLVKVSIAQDAKEAKGFLLDLDEDES